MVTTDSAKYVIILNEAVNTIILMHKFHGYASIYTPERMHMRSGSKGLGREELGREELGMACRATRGTKLTFPLNNYGAFPVCIR